MLSLHQAECGLSLAITTGLLAFLACFPAMKAYLLEQRDRGQGFFELMRVLEHNDL